MKVRQSGMPEEKLWSSFFNVNLILEELKIDASIKSLVEIGCGYGTFTIPAAERINGKIFSFDLEDEMLATTKRKLEDKGLQNVFLEKRDVLSQTTGLEKNSIDYVMLFNILHHESPEEFYSEAFRILKPSGKIGIIHWRSDIVTPRGPDLSIRPTAEQVLKQFDVSMFRVEKEPFGLEPYHYGLILSKA